MTWILLNLLRLVWCLRLSSDLTNDIFLKRICVCCDEVLYKCQLSQFWWIVFYILYLLQPYWFLINLFYQILWMIVLISTIFMNLSFDSYRSDFDSYINRSLGLLHHLNEFFFYYYEIKILNPDNILCSEIFLKHLFLLMWTCSSIPLLFVYIYTKYFL